MANYSPILNGNKIKIAPMCYWCYLMHLFFSYQRGYSITPAASFIRMIFFTDSYTCS